MQYTKFSVGYHIRFLEVDVILHKPPPNVDHSSQSKFSNFRSLNLLTTQPEEGKNIIPDRSCKRWPRPLIRKFREFTKQRTILQLKSGMMFDYFNRLFFALCYRAIPNIFHSRKCNKKLKDFSSLWKDSKWKQINIAEGDFQLVGLLSAEIVLHLKSFRTSLLVCKISNHELCKGIQSISSEWLRKIPHALSRPLKLRVYFT